MRSGAGRVSEDQLAMTAERAARYFWLLAAVHVVVWTLARFLAQPNAPLDVVEMAYVGHEWRLGYANHPPLAAWVTEASLAVGGVWVVYLASQLAMITCLWAAWRLGREMLTPGAALLGALVLECCLYYHFTTSEVNNNVALCPFWALSVLFFYRALQTGAARHWIAMGACLGVAMLAKYSLVMLLVPMVAFMVLHPRARRHVATPGPYLALCTAFVVFAPHLLWAGRQHFPALQWAIERTRGEEYSGSRLVNVLWFVKDQLPAVVPMLAVLLPLTGWRWRLRRLDPAERFARAFLVAMGLGPFVAQVILALALDLKLRSMYGSQLWTFTGVLLLFSLVLRPEAARWRSAAIGCVVIGGAMVFAAVFYDQAWPYVRPRQAHEHSLSRPRGSGRSQRRVAPAHRSTAPHRGGGMVAGGKRRLVQPPPGCRSTAADLIPGTRSSHPRTTHGRVTKRCGRTAGSSCGTPIARRRASPDTSVSASRR